MVAAVLASLALVPRTEAWEPCNGALKIGWGIAPIKLGLNVRQVRARLGSPDRISHAGPRFDRDAPVVRYHYRVEGLEVDFRQGRGYVWRVATTSRRYRTINGLGVGSSHARVRSLLTGETCHVAGGTGYCVVGGSHATFVYFRAGKVSSVAVQLVRGEY